MSVKKVFHCCFLISILFNLHPTAFASGIFIDPDLGDQVYQDKWYLPVHIEVRQSQELADKFKFKDFGVNLILERLVNGDENNDAVTLTATAQLPVFFIDEFNVYVKKEAVDDLLKQLPPATPNSSTTLRIEIVPRKIVRTPTGEVIRGKSGSGSDVVPFEEPAYSVSTEAQPQLTQSITIDLADTAKLSTAQKLPRAHQLDVLIYPMGWGKGVRKETLDPTNPSAALTTMVTIKEKTEKTYEPGFVLSQFELDVPEVAEDASK